MIKGLQIDPHLAHLPPIMTILGYLAAGAALTCSYLQLKGVLQLQAGLPNGGLVTILLPMALLFGGAVLARMSAHLWVRGLIGALFITAPAWVFIELTSIHSSFLSVMLGVEQSRAAETQSLGTIASSNRSQAAISTALDEIATSMENMPDNYHTLRSRSGEKLLELAKAQTDLVEATAATAQQQGAIHAAIGQGTQVRWATMLAIGLSVVVIAVQFSFGAISDSFRRREKNDSPKL